MGKPLFPLDDAPLLAPRQPSRPRPGYEHLAWNPHAGCFPQVEPGRWELCLWDIWHQGPELTDPLLARINRIEPAALDDESRYIRLQIACFNRCWWQFPANVDLILRGIGRGQAELSDHVSCEPPWFDFLGILRHRRGLPVPAGGRYRLAADGYPALSPRQSLARAYINILTWWTHGGDLQYLQLETPAHADLAATVYARLGVSSKLKILYVQKLRTTLGWEAFPDSRSELGWFITLLQDVINQELAGTPDPIGGLIEERNLCHHAFFRQVDHQIAAIGAGRRIDLPGGGQEHARITAAITNYVHALGSWLCQRTLDQANALWPDGLAVSASTYALLGAPSPVKRWLAACLWRKLQDNQAHHGRGALDEQPERFQVLAEALEAPTARL